VSRISTVSVAAAPLARPPIIMTSSRPGSRTEVPWVRLPYSIGLTSDHWLVAGSKYCDILLMPTLRILPFGIRCMRG
jgi:hypothetical protein